MKKRKCKFFHEINKYNDVILGQGEGGLCRRIEFSLSGIRGV